MRVNPRAKIPALQVGDFILAESAAILTYLADHFDAEEHEFVPPPKTRERATYDMWMFYRAYIPTSTLRICSGICIGGASHTGQIQELCAIVAVHFAAGAVMSEVDAQSLYIHRKHVGLKHIYGEAPVAVEAAKSYFQRQLAVITQQLEDSKGCYLLGSKFLAVDILLGALLIWAKGLGWLNSNTTTEAEGVVSNYLRRLTLRPAFLRTVKLGAFPNL